MIPNNSKQNQPIRQKHRIKVLGDRVCSFAGLGSFAEFLVAEQDELFKVPDGCDLVAAGALPVAFGTSNVALVHRAQLTSGVVVLGAAGGVVFCCSNWQGAVFEVIGVDHVVDSSKDSVISSVKDFLKARKLKGLMSCMILLEANY
uniref:Uncharacterized protein n=1 Tax=Salix viminalis TaxID=40686 RepID=A0A6N2LNE2_SALVM